MPQTMESITSSSIAGAIVGWFGFINIETNVNKNTFLYQIFNRRSAKKLINTMNSMPQTEIVRRLL